ncbi:MAG: hypothetical protein AB1Z98_33585 [Nannocystaceae bacterium]
MSPRLALVLLSMTLPVTACLDNLNQRKYFDVLQAAEPGLARRVERNRESIEQQLRATVRERSELPVEHVGLWGESWDLVRKVTDGEQLFMRGRVFHPEGPASTYYLAFTVAEDGTVEIADARVYSSMGRGPR